MYCLANMCYVCLKNKNKILNNISSSLSGYKDLINIIGCLPFNLAWLKTKRIIMICEECCLRLRETYHFLEMCLRNSALLQGYTDNLNTTTTSNRENEAELLVHLNITHENIQHEVNNEIKLEDEEICIEEYGPIIEGDTEDVVMDFEDSLIKEEIICKNEEVDVKKVYPMNNNSTESLDKEFYACAICKISFKQKSGLLNHMRVHTGEKPYKCSRCESCFNLKSNLLIHMRTHTGEKPYKCSRCKSCFSQKSNLVIHMRTHTGEKPYKCSRCKACFRRKDHLVIHMRTHTGEKPYECSRCKICFSRKGSLLIHMRTHTGEKPYECVRCKTCFSQKSNLVRHNMRIHTVGKSYK